MISLTHPATQVATVALAACLTLTVAGAGAAEFGPLEDHADIGAVGHPGSASYDADSGKLTVTGSGTNMWLGEDELHFVYKKVTGDAMLEATINFVGEGVDPHRKACLIVRQTLDTGSVYADAAVHGDGLTSLQYRLTPGDDTHEITSNATGPKRMRIERIGDYVSMSIAGEGEELAPAGGSLRLKLEGEYYIGIGVCSHNNTVSETAEFTDIALKTPADESARTELVSTLETIDISNNNRTVVYSARQHFEAPNWSRDGGHFVYNSRGKLYKLPVAGGTPEEINTGSNDRCNNDHGISPDGTQLVISDQSENGRSKIYLLPAEGVADGVEPKLITPNAPSYWHGWSPDGQTLAYCAERDGEYDIYTIPVTGGEEKRLTSAEGLDDGPDYSPDGKYIYFNSVRTGTMQVWRIDADGGNPTQLTHGDRHEWFPHPSPDGRWLVYVSFLPEVDGHPANQHVELRIMPAEGGEPRTIATLFGGQGTINVPSWSPDSRRVAFVSYQFVEP